jgi:hypothetical protein
MHARFGAAARAHNDTWDLYRFSEAPEQALDRMLHRRTLRGSLNERRFEFAYLKYCAVRFC